MIDTHSHLLPAIDDGASSLSVSIDMLDAYVANGFRSVSVTPHLTKPLTSEYQARIDAAVALVEPHARERGISLIRGFEIRLEPGIPRQLAEGAPITLDGGNVVLVDLPFTEWPLYADFTLFAVQTAGYRVILAHPERYPGIQDNLAKADDLMARGIILQVTIGSFAGAFGKRAQTCAEALVARGVVQLAATDAHTAGHRMAAVPAGLVRMRNLIGQARLDTLTIVAPAMLLNGDGVPLPVRPVVTSWRQRISLLRR